MGGETPSRFQNALNFAVAPLWEVNIPFCIYIVGLGLCLSDNVAPIRAMMSTTGTDARRIVEKHR